MYFRLFYWQITKFNNFQISFLAFHLILIHIYKNLFTFIFISSHIDKTIWLGYLNSKNRINLIEIFP